MNLLSPYQYSVEDNRSDLFKWRGNLISTNPNLAPYLSNSTLFRSASVRRVRGRPKSAKRNQNNQVSPYQVIPKTIRSCKIRFKFFKPGQKPRRTTSGFQRSLSSNRFRNTFSQDPVEYSQGIIKMSKSRRQNEIQEVDEVNQRLDYFRRQIKLQKQ